MTSPTTQQTIDFAIKWGIPLLLSGIAVWIIFAIALHLAKREAKITHKSEDTAPPLIPKDGSLQWAISWIIKSAWGKWQEAQHLGHNKVQLNDFQKLHFAVIAIETHAGNGELVIRGRPSGSIVYEDIPRDLWKIAALNITNYPDQIHIAPKTTLEQEAAVKIPKYTGLQTDWRRVVYLWPEKDKNIDTETEKLLSEKPKPILPERTLNMVGGGFFNCKVGIKSDVPIQMNLRDVPFVNIKKEAIILSDTSKEPEKT